MQICFNCQSVYQTRLLSHLSFIYHPPNVLSAFWSRAHAARKACAHATGRNLHAQLLIQVSKFTQKPLTDSDSPYIHRSKKRKADFDGHRPVLTRKLTRSISMPSAQVQRPNGSKAKPYIIGVVGGTNSGKSSVCKKIITEVSNAKKLFILIKIDKL